MKGIRLGQLLVQQGVLSEQQVQHILKVQQAGGRPFGDLAERLYGICPSVIEDAWIEQYVRLAGITDLDDLRVDEECLRLLNRRQAWQFHVLPINHESDGVGLPQLNIATSPDNLVRAMNFATSRVQENVYFVLAERKQLREFLMKHYPVPEHIAAYAEKM